MDKNDSWSHAVNRGIVNHGHNDYGISNLNIKTFFEKFPKIPKS